MGKTKELFAAGIVELLGTFALCTFGGFSCLHAEANPARSITQVAVAHGMVLSIFVWAGAATSGSNYNWAVTLTLAGLKRIPVGTAIVYLVMQTLGSILAGFTIYFTGLNFFKNSKNHTGYPGLNPAYDQTVGFFCEAIGTALLMYMIMALAVDKRGPQNVFGIGIGLALYVSVLSIGPVTGSCLNPARLLGPFMVAVVYGGVNQSWTNTWIYMLGPIFGALLGGFYYEFFMLSEENDDELEEVDSEDEDEAVELKGYA